MNVKCPVLGLVGALVWNGCGGDLLSTDAALSAGSQGPPPVLAAGGGVAAAPTSQAAAGASGYISSLSSGRSGAAGSSMAQAGDGAQSAPSGTADQAASEAGRASRSRWRPGTGAAGAGSAGGAGTAGAPWLFTGASGAAAHGGAGAGSASGASGAGVPKDAGTSSVAESPDGGRCEANLACQLAALPSTADVHQDCVDRINQFREECACLPPLERWVEGEACADEMAQYDSSGTQAHAAFGDKICDGGSAQNECPGWRSEAQIVGVCLQKMWDEGPPPMSDCSGSCFQTYGHFLNMTNQRMTKVACGFYTTPEGQVWSVQNFAR